MTFDPKKTAVISLDMQEPVFGFLPGAEVILPSAAVVANLGRATGCFTMHVGLGFEPGYPEISPRNARFSMLKERGLFIKGSESARINDAVFQPGDTVVYKHRVGAFSGNALEMILRARGIEHLVLYGIATSGIVLSTVRAASDLDFTCTVVKDACFDGDAEVHRVLTEKIFVAQGTVVTADALRREFAPA
jgi:nicotinamidase-related amidase